MSRTTYLPYLAGITMSLIFGFSYLFIQEGLKVFTTFELLAYRFTLAAIVITGLALTKVIKINFRDKPIRMLILVSLFQPICFFICETLGLIYTSVSEVGIFIAFIPIFVTILAYYILKEKPYGKQAIFILISVSGALFNVVMSGSFEHKGNLIGILFLIGIVLSAGGYNIMTRKSSKIFSPMEITFFMMWSGAIFFIFMNLIEILCLGTDSSFIQLFTIQGAVPILYLGILSSIGAFFLLNYVLSKLSVASASVFSQMASVVTILSGIMVRGETLEWYQILSGILILSGVCGTNYWESRKRKDMELET